MERKITNVCLLLFRVTKRFIGTLFIDNRNGVFLLFVNSFTESTDELHI